ncbi:MAG: hypothetical protein JNL67_23240 [Planctomycetaceae bacterium]|nr:hypothetical protein [Planctomycetaceae bacterium]
MSQRPRRHLFQSEESLASSSNPSTRLLPNRIEIRVRHLNQLFNSLDPSPFYEQDLDPDAEEFIVGWARELPRKAPFEIVLHLSEKRTDDLTHSEVEEKIGQAISKYFDHRSHQEGRRLAELLRIGRISFLIGVMFLVGCFSIANLITLWARNWVPSPWGSILRESFIIIGWVAMWRPLEIFLYDWWPIAGSRTLYSRLSNANFKLIESMQTQAD